jgi:hypothetical protein
MPGALDLHRFTRGSAPRSVVAVNLVHVDRHACAGSTCFGGSAWTGGAERCAIVAHGIDATGVGRRSSARRLDRAASARRLFARNVANATHGARRDASSGQLGGGAAALHPIRGAVRRSSGAQPVGGAHRTRARLRASLCKRPLRSGFLSALDGVGPQATRGRTRLGFAHD